MTPDPGATPAADRRTKILQARARALALVPEAAASDQKRLEALRFRLASETYAVELRFVAETHPMKACTPIPCTPAHVFGMVNVHGRLVTVLDLKKLFGMPDAGLTDRNKVIVLRREGLEFGLLADAVVGVDTLSESELQTSLPTFGGVRTDYLRGITKERLIVLDAEKLLTSKALVVHEEPNG